MSDKLKAYRVNMVTPEDVKNGARNGMIVYLHSEGVDGLYNFIDKPDSTDGIPLYMQQVGRVALFDVDYAADQPPVEDSVVEESSAVAEVAQQERGAGVIEEATPVLQQIAALGRAAGLKHDAGKPQPRLLFEGVPLALEEVVRTLTFGAQKYEAHSWQHVEKADERYQDASYRHDMARNKGELLDPETGIRHRAHHIINELFLLELELRSERV